MSFDNQRGKLRKIWNKNKEAKSNLEALPTPIPKKLSEIVINKYVKNLYASEWENTELTLPNSWEETWTFEDPYIPPVDFSHSYYAPPVQLPGDRNEDTNSLGNTFRTGRNRWTEFVSFYVSLFTHIFFRPASRGSARGSVLRQFTGTTFLFESSTTATTIIDDESLFVASEGEARIYSALEVDNFSLAITPNTSVEILGTYTHTVNGLFEDIGNIVAFAFSVQSPALDDNKRHTIVYEERYGQYSPYNTFYGEELVISETVSNINRSLSDDIITSYLNSGEPLELIESNLNSGSIKLGKIQLNVLCESFPNKFNMSLSEERTASSDLNFTNNSIKVIRADSGVATFKFDLISNEFALPEKLTPYLNIEVISKLIDEDISSFDVRANLEDLQTKFLLIQTGELDNGFKKYRAKATGAFFKEIESEDDITDYPQVMMFVNFIRPEDYKQVNNHKFR